MGPDFDIEYNILIDTFEKRGFYVHRLNDPNSLKTLCALTIVKIRPDVIALVYVGHGQSRNTSENQFGIMAYGNSTLTHQEIVQQLKTFTGTFIEVLVMCHAGPNTPHAHNDASSVVDSGRYGDVIGAPGCVCFLIFASPDNSPMNQFDANRFIILLQAALDGTHTYDEFIEVMNAWALHPCPTTASSDWVHGQLLLPLQVTGGIVPMKSRAPLEREIRGYLLQKASKSGCDLIAVPDPHSCGHAPDASKSKKTHPVRPEITTSLLANYPNCIRRSIGVLCGSFPDVRKFLSTHNTAYQKKVTLYQSTARPTPHNTSGTTARDPSTRVTVVRALYRTPSTPS